ncbi:hypothetical protein GGG16DRAFT_94209 [Schizophyllum commune]
MPAPVASSSSLHPAKPAVPKKHAQPAAANKKTRTIRRRGPRRNGADSDDELEREVGSDSESDYTVSSASSDEDSELDDAHPENRSHPLTPSTSQSPEDGASVTKDVPPSTNGKSSFFTDANAWSEMVADETQHGQAELPEIDFEEFEGNSSAIDREGAPSPEEAQPSTSSTRVDDDDPEHTPTSSRPKREREPIRGKAPGFSARQAYQKRLEDPAFVPVVGEFWGHDDRLLDKSLRSLSGWWRGRWQGRGRGMGFRGRGRGGYFGGPGRPGPEEVEEENLPPVERTWRHDGFEEMQKQEEQRRTVLQRRQAQQQPFPRGAGNFRGRGFAPPRGGFAPFRGGINSSPSTRTNSLFPPRAFFAMKPEKVFTKQHEAFLYFDAALKPRPGQPPAYRVRVGDEAPTVVRATSYPRRRSNATKPAIAAPEAAITEFVVRLPKSTGKAKASAPEPKPAATAPAPAPAPTEKPAPRRPASPASAPAPPPPKAEPPKVAPVEAPPVASTSQQPPPPAPAAAPAPPKEEPFTAPPPASAPAFVPAEPPGFEYQQPPHLPPPPVSAPARPNPAPIQTVFTPPPPQSPSYGSPYGYAAPLPPGVAYNHMGGAYEIATGRAVYLQPPPPPPAPMPMYAPPPPQPVMSAPQPVMHGMPSSGFMAGHLRHHSHVSTDFLPHPHTPLSAHTPPVGNLIDPSTGAPIFAPPRQTSRVQIRAPTGEEGKGKVSGLRSSAVPFQPPVQEQQQQPQHHQQHHQPQPSYGEADMTGQVAPVNGGYMGYNPYQQYYYPESYGYPYQGNPYEAYPVDQQGGYEQQVGYEAQPVYDPQTGYYQ